MFSYVFRDALEFSRTLSRAATRDTMVTMSVKSVHWLLGELDSLVAKEVLSPGAADRLRAHYGARASAGDRRIRELFFALIGALLVGGGVILLLAHNWTLLSRAARTVVAFTPLVVAHTVAGFTLARRRESAAWREGAAIAVVLASAAAIGLIGQTYHIPGDLHDFLAVWMLLTLPVLYVLDAVSVALLYLIGIVCWVAGVGTGDGNTLYWLFLAAAMPFVVPVLRARGAAGALLGWGLAATVVPGALFSAHDVARGFWWPTLAVGLGAYVAGGAALRLRDDEADTSASWRADPLLVIGTVGLIVLALVASTRDAWSVLERTPRSFEFGASVEAWLLLIGFGAVLVLSAIDGWRNDRHNVVMAGVRALPLFLVVGWAIAVGTSLDDGYLAIAFNLYLAALGVVAIVLGVRRGRVEHANGGLAILSVLVVVRFFDSDLPLVIRGVAFVVMGLGFLFANQWLGRRAAAVRVASVGAEATGAESALNETPREDSRPGETEP